MEKMKTRARIAVTAIIAALALGLGLCLKSGRMARLACDKLVGEKLTDMPHFSTRFTFSPSAHLKSQQPLQRRASWIVSYSDSLGGRSLGFQTDLNGNVLASGSPISVPVVANYLAGLRAKDDEIANAVARADGLVKHGMTYSNLIEELGQPSWAMTEQAEASLRASARTNGSPNGGVAESNLIAAMKQSILSIAEGEAGTLHYHFGEANMPGSFLTNEIEVAVSNGIVIWKVYGCGGRME